MSKTDLQRRIQEAGARRDFATMYRLQDEWIAADRAEHTEQRRSRSLDKLEPPSHVRITWAVRRSLQEAAAQWSRGGLESGGFLFGRMRPDVFGLATRVDILEFSRPRMDDKRTAKTIELSEAHREDAFAGRLSEYQLIGDYHTHPNGTLAPSEIDLLHWGGLADRSWARRNPAPGHVGVIIGPDPGQDWIPPAMRFRAWFVPPLRWDVTRAACEPTALVIREESSIY